MKIIVSPAKTQQSDKRLSIPFRTSDYKEKSNYLLEILSNYDRETLGKKMSIKGDLLDETFNNIASYEQLTPTHGIQLYTGLVFKGLETLIYSENELQYLERHVRILSAFYGIVHPFDSVRPYRLDMKMKVLSESLYNYWNESFTSVFEGETIINLASNEFSKLIQQPMITIDFKEEKGPSLYKTVGTYAKQARGKMLSWMIRNNVQSLDQLKTFNLWGYRYSQALSNEDTLVFLRDKNFSLKNSE